MMSEGALRRFGPAFIANAAANILSEPASGTYYKIKHIQIVNVGDASSFSLYIGATGGSAAGTQIGGGTRAVAANTAGNTSVVDLWFDDLLQKNTEFLTGVAANASRLAITIEYEICYMVA
jgi:hypothetical protein